MASGDWMELHKLLLQQNRERIEVAYLKAREKQIEHPVVVLLDLRDPEALQIAYTTGRQADIDAQVAEAERREVVPVVLWHIPVDFAQRLFASRLAVRESLVTPTNAGEVYHVVVVSGGGISTCVIGAPDQVE